MKGKEIKTVSIRESDREREREREAGKTQNVIISVRETERDKENMN